MSKGTQVRVTENTKEAITAVAADLQRESKVRITTDIAIRYAIAKAFPELAQEMGIDINKELEERRK